MPPVRTRPAALAAALLALACTPVVARAQDPAPSDQVPTPPVTTPAAPAPPATGTFALSAERVGRAKAVLSGTRFRIRGVVVPYVAGQTAVVRIARSGRRVLTKQVRLLPSRTGQSGYFVMGYRSKRLGTLTVAAEHVATPELAPVAAAPVTVHVLPRRVAPGSRGTGVRILQQGLRRLGYVVGRPGLMDARTSRAVLAFRKVTGMARTMSADGSVFRKLAAGAGRFPVRFPDHGKHVEADLSRQVLALIRGSQVERIYPVSSGKPSTPTVLGHFRFYSKSPGFNAKGMYFSNYFVRGYAIHGYVEVPPYAASHGCLRVPIPDAVPIYQWVQIGDRIDVYR